MACKFSSCASDGDEDDDAVGQANYKENTRKMKAREGNIKSNWKYSVYQV